MGLLPASFAGCGKKSIGLEGFAAAWKAAARLAAVDATQELS